MRRTFLLIGASALLSGAAIAESIPKGAVLLFNKECPVKEGWVDVPGSDGIYVIGAGSNHRVGDMHGSNTAAFNLTPMPVSGVTLRVSKDQIEHNPGSFTVLGEGATAKPPASVSAEVSIG